VIVTGHLQDTVVAFGQYLPLAGSHLYVGRLNSGGTLQALKLSTNTDSLSGAYALDCAADAGGNTYLFMYGTGGAQLDTFSIGIGFGGVYVLVKLDQQFNTQWTHKFPFCYMYCPGYGDLQVSASGRSYVLSSTSDYHSGGDDMFTTIHYINSSGNSVKTFGLQKHNFIPAIDLDSCGNVYFSGYQRSHTYSNPMHYYLPVGQLSPDLDLNWIREDSMTNDFRIAGSISALAVNDCFVNGYYTNQLTLADTLTDSTSAGQDNYFLARLQTIVGPPQNVTATGNDVVCTGQTAVLAGMAAAPINWYQNSAGGTSLYTGNSFTVPLLGAGAYTYYAEASTCSMTTARLPITLTLIPSPTIQVANGTVCQPGTYTISPSGAQQYYFSSGTSVVSPAAATTYTIYGVGANGCADSALCLITPVPASQPTIVTSINFMCPGQTAILSCLGAGSYTWQTGLANQPLAVSPTVHTTYSVTMLDSNGCAGTDVITQYVAGCTGLADSGVAEQKIYPNPTDGQVLVSSQSAARVELLNCNGQRVLLVKLEAGENTIDLAPLPAGLYLLCGNGTCRRIVRR
jgi:hypothetical protein